MKACFTHGTQLCEHPDCRRENEGPVARGRRLESERDAAVAALEKAHDELADARHDEQARIGIARVKSSREGFALGVVEIGQWCGRHAGDATLDRTGVQRETLLFLAKRIPQLATELSPDASLCVVPRAKLEALRAVMRDTDEAIHNAARALLEGVP